MKMIVSRKFPGVTFIWKYERPEDEISDGIDNLVEATWLPQIDLLCEFVMVTLVSKLCVFLGNEQNNL